METQTKEQEEEVVEEEEKEDDDTELKQLIDLQVKEVIGEQKRELEQKAEKHAREAREKGYDPNANEARENQAEMRDFLKGLISNDSSYLKSYKEKSQSTTDADGGYLVPEILTQEIARIPENQYGLARQAMRVWTFSGPGNEREIPVLDSNVSASWISEKGKKPGTKFTLTRPTLSLKKLAAIVPMTEEIVEDSAVPLESFTAEIMNEQFAKKEDEEFFSTGDGEFTGILDDGNVSVATSVAPASLDADHLADLQFSVSTSIRSEGTYYLSPTVFNHVRQLKDNDGQYIVQLPTESRPGTIWERPYVLSDAFPAYDSVGTGDNYVIFGSLRRAAAYGEKQGIRTKMLDQATIEDSSSSTIHLAMEDLVAIRFMKRVGYVLYQPAAVAAIANTT